VESENVAFVLPPYTSDNSACLQASAGMWLRTALVWVIKQRVVAITDVSGQHIGSIFKYQELGNP
jgi:hypothetical protein